MGVSQPAASKRISFHQPHESKSPGWSLACLTQIIDTFICPSVSRSVHTTGDINGNGDWDRGDDMGLTDYGGMHGLSKPPFLSFSEQAVPWVHSPQFRGGMSYEVELRPREFGDGLSNTVLAAECVRGNRFQSEWANGQNLFDQQFQNPINVSNNNEIYSEHPTGAMMLFGDGHVQHVAETIAQEVLNASLTRAGKD